MADFLNRLKGELKEIEEQGLYKRERPLTSPQGAVVRVEGDGRPVLNLCANNYLGLADNPLLVKAAQETLAEHGLGMASVRFICGTHALHRQLEERIAGFLEMDDAILYAACFDANGGVFEPLFDEKDAIVSDTLNHASIIDGVRLCKAKRYRYRTGDAEDLESQLKQARADGAREIIVATDGVFSMDGIIADLKTLRALADRYEALLMVDDCHGLGVLGSGGRGTPDHHRIKPDIITGTLGKSLGGSVGGFVAASQPIVDMLRQRSRPYLFSNALPPMVVAAAIKAIDLCEAGDALREQLIENTRRFRQSMQQMGFEVRPGEHPITPVMTGEGARAQELAKELYELGVYVVGFFYPVVPKGQARIRVQLSAALAPEHVTQALAAFATAGRKIGLIR